MTEFHHGITAREAALGKIPIRNADTNIMAMIAYANDADEGAFPLNTPVLVTSINRVLPKAGATGNLRKNLEIISAITSPTLVVIRIADPFAEGEFDQSVVIGTTADIGHRTGLQALLTVKSQLGITPKIICVSDTETIDVANALGAICKKLRAYAYITPRNEAGEMLPTAEAVAAFRQMLAFREIELIWPEWTSGNVFLGESQITPSIPPFPPIPDENISDRLNYSGWFGLTWLSDIKWNLVVDGVLYKQTTPFGKDENGNGLGMHNTMDGSITQIIQDNNLTFLDTYQDSSGGGNIFLNIAGPKKIQFIPQSLTTDYPDKYPTPITDNGGAIPIIDPITKIWSFILKKSPE